MPACSYEGRCSLPSNFDATYCNALGQAAGALVASGQTGLMATVSSELMGQAASVFVASLMHITSQLVDFSARVHVLRGRRAHWPST